MSVSTFLMQLCGQSWPSIEGPCNALQNRRRGGRLTNFTTVGDCARRKKTIHWVSQKFENDADKAQLGDSDHSPAACGTSSSMRRPPNCGELAEQAQSACLGCELTQNLLHLHDARVSTDVVHRVGGLGGVHILLLEDIVEGERLLRSCHGGQSGVCSGDGRRRAR